MNLDIKNWISNKIKFNKLLLDKINQIDSYLESSCFEEKKNNEFISLIQDTSNRNPFYNDFYKKNDVNISEIKHYSEAYKLPVLTKDLIKSNYTKIKTKNKFFFKGYTSGTSGAPLVIYRTLSAILNENAYVWWYRKQSGLNIGDKIISIRGDLDKKQIYYYDKFSNTLHLSSFALNEKNIKIIFNKIEQFQAKAIIGYPSSINTLANLLNLLNKKIEIPLTFTSSETLFFFQKQSIEKTFKTIIYDWYGNSERTIALYSSNDFYFEPPMYAINNYKKNKILTTSLINKDFPLINYEVGDLVKTSYSYDDAKKSIIIDSISGRKNDYIQLFDGSTVGTAALSLIFKGLDIQVSQIIYFKKGVFNFNIVVGVHFSNKDRGKLETMIINKLGKENIIKINIISMNDIIYTNSGKFIFIVKEK